MSHYITAEIDKNEIELTGGSNHRTIRAVSESGFSIYGMFEAGEFHNGMSGSGEVKKVDFKIAEQAYRHAIAWALSLQQSFPDMFKQEIEKRKSWDAHFRDYIFNDIFDEAEINALIEQKNKYQYELSEDTIERAFRLFYGISRFTSKVYEYTKRGNEVEIFFG